MNWIPPNWRPRNSLTNFFFSFGFTRLCHQTDDMSSCNPNFDKKKKEKDHIVAFENIFHLFSHLSLSLQVHRVKCYVAVTLKPLNTRHRILLRNNPPRKRATIVFSRRQTSYSFSVTIRQKLREIRTIGRKLRLTF